MKKNNTPLIILAVLAILLFIYFMMSNKKTKYSWQENYKEGNKEPYGLYIFKQITNQFSPAHTINTLSDLPAKALPTKTPTNENYVFVGETAYWDSTDIAKVTDFVRNGNSALIISKSLTPQFRDSILRPFVCVNQDLIPEPDTTYVLGEEGDTIDIEIEEPFFDAKDFSLSTNEKIFFELNDTVAHLNLNHSSVHLPKPTEYKYYFRNGYYDEAHKAQSYVWSYINLDAFCYIDEIELLGSLDSTTNFVKIPYGKGSFLIHTTPLAFTNYHLLKRAAVDYAQGVLSYLPAGKTYWDEPSKTYRTTDNSNNWESEVDIYEDSPLQFILKNPPLKWAWYLALASLLIYLFFRTKRTQRIIPVIEPNANTSLEFTQSIGRLYFLQNNHKQLAELRMKLFLHFIRDRYIIATNIPEKTLITRIIEKSSVSDSVVNNIFEWYRYIRNTDDVSEEQLIDFYKEMQFFYKHCK